MYSITGHDTWVVHMCWYIHNITPCHVSSFSRRIQLKVKHQVPGYIVVTNRNFPIYLQQFEGDMWIIHLLLDVILTNCAAITLIEANCLFKCIYDFNPKFHFTLLNTLSFQSSNQAIILSQSIFYPSLKWCISCKAIRNKLLRQFNMVASLNFSHG